MGASAKSKNQKRRERQRQRKLEEHVRASVAAAQAAKAEQDGHSSSTPSAAAPADTVAAEPTGEALAAFAGVFGHFAKPEDIVANTPVELAKLAAEREAAAAAADGSGELGEGSGEGLPSGSGSASRKRSRADSLGCSKRKKQKKQSRFTVAELKTVVTRPDLVEAHDVASPDALTLLQLKSMRNTVPVPQHWRQANKYLQKKRGQERVAFKLPAFIQDTGVNKIRAALAEAEATAKSSTKSRERTQPKMGKMDIDYQVLHDAFFKYQTKPPLKGFGAVYFDGMEKQANKVHFRPGQVSKGLREALGMQDGGPPPWLFNMQRFGPPPSFPHLKVPGVNAPIPAGAAWGMHHGGWGQAPMDQFGTPIFGDVLGVSGQQGGADADADAGKPEEEGVHWGDVVDDEDDDEEDSDEDEDGDDDSDDDSDDGGDGEGDAKADKGEGEEAAAGDSDDDSDDDDDANKKKKKKKKKGRRGQEEDDEEEVAEKDKTLFKVIDEEDTKVGSSEAMGGQFKYNLGKGKNKMDEPRAKSKAQPTKPAAPAPTDDDDLEKNFKF